MSTQNDATLADQLDRAQAEYDAFAQRGLHLDITRGKPAPAQLDLANDLLTLVHGDDALTPSGVDSRNYGGIEGLVELREIFAELLSVSVNQITAQGNSSLSLMRDALMYALLFGTPAGGSQPWISVKRALLCPVPGYDRHFSLAESLGFELISVPMDQQGPSLEHVREAVQDPRVKGMWLVPMYSNPTGVSISRQRTQELLELDTAAPDFTLLWDNAYALHHLAEPHAPMLNVLELAQQAGHPNRVWEFASTSKITLAGAGVAFFAASEDNLRWFLGHLEEGAIGPDKVNQLRHLRFFKDADGVRAHMQKHAEIIAPKFEAVEGALREGLGQDGPATWTAPNGGYFITLTVTPGTADRVVKLAGEAGVKLTPAGATHPYGLDPENATIRIAPTMPSLPDVETAAQGLVACVRLAALEQQASTDA